MYVNPNFKTKKALKDAIKNGEIVDQLSKMVGNQSKVRTTRTIKTRFWSDAKMWIVIIGWIVFITLGGYDWVRGFTDKN